ncbi:MAG TPA: DUF3618 domain-containing protein [Candidatus Sulfomarinibacteraceae bacterium]|nr:DUF3618 domain-containing protein [Candidatus Sulfomarinibacteraceae bacterium]
MADTGHGREPEQILREIERTRGDLDQTFDELIERVDPRRLLAALRRVAAEAMATAPAASLAGAFVVGALLGTALGRRR